MDAVEVNDSVLGGDLALLERIHHEQVPHVAIFDIFAERRPSLVGRVLFPGPLRVLPDRLVPGEWAARAQDHIRDLALFQVAAGRRSGFDDCQAFQGRHIAESLVGTDEMVDGE
jgi:hypothetical protein